ncbi:ABC transporter ATP-binding protein [Gordonia sp. ABSL1-1]|uniref:ABC transporter ATP-binding protein n=1 Tax=Gordonia sp. ABSL1-1 TaxID=3053923 RepID=UPI002572B3B7|nr:ABC transporter ATP-binding protein [Gordonia sp. ABSL1-1]MDL9935688.1 ABC transporter ATP-binding protein [Gordonia sp. ABSL1-1]
MLDIDGVRLDYGATTVIDDLSWQVGTAGAPVTALLGPSGCGKSTLIRAVAGLEPVAAGHIRFDGDDLAQVPVHRRDFGVVFQDGQLFGGRTVAANVGYGLRMRRWPRRRIADRVAEMLQLVELPDLADRRVGELSGGQAQRVALARALAPSPRLLLLDEPLAALDRGLREQLAVDIAGIVRDAATPTIVVTHDHTEAALMADRIAVMRAGRIVQSATPDDLWLAPVDAEVARFLGCTTVLDATVRGRVAETAFGPVPVDLPDGPRRLGLRPESVSADPVGPDADGGTGLVVRVAPLPGGTRVWVDCVAGEVEAVATAPVSVGDGVTLGLRPGRVAVIGG